MENILYKNNPHNMTVAIVGAGYIGSVLTSFLADNDVEVTTIDINKNIINKINLGQSL